MKLTPSNPDISIFYIFCLNYLEEIGVNMKYDVASIPQLTLIPISLVEPE